MSLKELSKTKAGQDSIYVDALLDIGAAGQVLLRAAYTNGLGASITPAVSESRTAALLGLDEETEEAVYFFKVGIPEHNSTERRSPI